MKKLIFLIVTFSKLKKLHTKLKKIQSLSIDVRPTYCIVNKDFWLHMKKTPHSAKLTPLPHKKVPLVFLLGMAIVFEFSMSRQIQEMSDQKSFY